MENRDDLEREAQEFLTLRQDPPADLDEGENHHLLLALWQELGGEG